MVMVICSTLRSLSYWSWSECGNNFEFFRYFAANWLWKGEWWAVVTSCTFERKGRVRVSGDYNCSFHFITHHHCINYSIQMLCCKKLMIVGIFCHFNQCVWQLPVCAGSEWIELVNLVLCKYTCLRGGGDLKGLRLKYNTYTYFQTTECQGKFQSITKTNIV